MSHLEPTYLRFIHDGILNGSIHKDNAADLPDGLIGLYEEAFDDGTSVIERQKLLQRFAIWALLKKEVSVAFKFWVNQKMKFKHSYRTIALGSTVLKAGNTNYITSA